MSLQHSPRIITDGLVLCLDAANRQSYPGSGDVWTDLAGSNNGTLINGPTFSNANGGSIVFDGSDDYVIVETNSSLEFGSNNFTIQVWLRPVFIQPPNAVISKGNIESVDDEVWTLEWAGDNQLTFYGPSGLNPIVTSTTSFQTLKWYNVCVLRENNIYKLFVNTYLESIQANSDAILSGGNLYIGSGWYDPSSRSLNGNISQASIYNRALTPAEILQNYNATKGRYNL
jgi:hypothetical protein